MKYKDGYKYQLYEDEHFVTHIYPGEEVSTSYLSLSLRGELLIKAGYAWDGPSGPTIDTKSSMRGSLFHDAMYQLIRMNKLDKKWRPYVDELFGMICKSDGMWHWRASIWVRELKNFGGSAASERNRKKILTAP